MVCVFFLYRIRLEGQEAHVQDMRHTYILVDYLEGRRNLKDLYLDEKVILKWILIEYNVRMWAGCLYFRIGISDGARLRI
jgi:hypothetical protein